MKQLLYVYLGIVVFFSVLIVPAENWGQSATLILYTNIIENVSYEIPYNWTVKEMNQYGKGYVVRMAAIAEAEDNFRENINLVVEDLENNMTLSQYLEANLRNMPTILNEFKKYQSGVLQDANEEGKFIVYGHKYGSNNLKVVCFLYIKEKKGYCLTCTSRIDRYARFEDLFMLIGKSFKFNF